MSHIGSRTKINKKYEQNALTICAPQRFRVDLATSHSIAYCLNSFLFLLSKYSIQFSGQQKQFLFLYSYSIGLCNRPLNLVITKLLSGERTRLTLVKHELKEQGQEQVGCQTGVYQPRAFRKDRSERSVHFFRGNSSHGLFSPAPSETMESLSSTCPSVSTCISLIACPLLACFLCKCTIFTHYNFSLLWVVYYY